MYTGVAKWKEAENYCDSIIDLGVYNLESNPLAPFITDNDNSIENIFTIPFDEDNLQGFRIHMRTLHYQNNLTFDMSVGPWNGFAVTESHFNSYEDGDLRKEGFLVGQQYTSSGAKIFDATADADLVFNPHIPAIVIDATYSLEEVRMSGARVAKYKIKKGAKENLSNDFPLFRYADILLMKAECMIRQGLNGDQYFNTIRQRAGVSSMSNVTLDQLLAERGREMFCEGHRRQDLIRFGKFSSARWEKPTDSDDRKTFPIPQWAIDSNPNLQ
ncbi:MAG: RagB/SusD family nutrient uptake outer membrane protein [Saprospiraceae bacterium]